MSNDSIISCPKCGADIPLTEAVSHRLREDLQVEFERDRAELNAAMALREEKLADAAGAVERRAQAVTAEVAGQLAAEREKLLATAARQAEVKLTTDLQDLRKQVADQAEKLTAARTAELQLLNDKRQLADAMAGLDLEVARKLDEERGRIAADARQQAAEAGRLKLADKENIIGGLQRQIADLQQKAEQGSMQAQGETLELTLEADLRSAFVCDTIAEVKKGERGADITQQVRTNGGVACGTILWEAKRARNWSAQWPGKLREDQRAAGAELAVIVTTCPPTDQRGIGQVDGIWICEPAFALALASALRHGLVSAAAQRRQEIDRGDKMAVLYDYLCGIEFRQHIQAVVESFVDLQQQLEAEKRAFARQWKEREKQLQKAIRHTGELYGGIQGIAGHEALPDVQSLQLPG